MALATLRFVVAIEDLADADGAVGERGEVAPRRFDRGVPSLALSSWIGKCSEAVWEARDRGVAADELPEGLLPDGAVGVTCAREADEPDVLCRCDAAISLI